MTSTKVEEQDQRSDPNEVDSNTWITNLIQHFITPGSALTPLVWVLFNTIMVSLFIIWLTFIETMPDNVHLWVFGLLGIGLAVSTNWLMTLVFKSGLNYDPSKDTAAHRNNHTAISKQGTNDKNSNDRKDVTVAKAKVEQSEKKTN